ncbi:hypothetical protein [Hansschlegelia zhihuaiae]|uniref:CopL family metal-binding regulatory protein n=1 Tax=Hansschlegelia zhihuaiae TaxID=405005 RepID=A0A4Q0MHV4_9HYPH|nr:hypothetical protein [Hansschlegelia zhihuaiae]RXF73177.1 hypothetical protein EK403_11885 [Hansschlegelia zhihuaiae]
MTVARLIRLVAAMAFAVFVAAAWSTPSAAHAGHETPQAGAQSQEPTSIGSIATDSRIEHAKASPGDAATSAASGDCSDDGCPNGTTACCGHACHAAMAHDLAMLGSRPVGATAAPSLSEPATLAGPTVHIKHPPRPLAAVG